MLCSNCSEQIHPVVSLDIDGTLGDYHTHLISFAEAYLQRKLFVELKRAYRTDETSGGPFLLAQDYDGSSEFRDWFETFGVSNDEFRRIKLAFRQGSVKRWMPVYDGVAELGEMLQRQEAEVWVCTTRPYQSLDNIDPDTRFWLERAGVAYTGMLFDDDKYDQLYKRVWPERVVAVLDDLPEQIEEAGRLFGTHIPIMPATRYNRGVRSRITVDGLDEARQVIEQRILRWRSDHA